MGSLILPAALIADGLTISLDDDTYDLIKSAAEGQMRSISNFGEFASVSYLTEEAFVSDQEMSGLMSDTELVQTLKKNKPLQTAYRRVVEIVYPMLRREPHFGPSIKRLRGELNAKMMRQVRQLTTRRYCSSPRIPEQDHLQEHRRVVGDRSVFTIPSASQHEHF